MIRGVITGFILLFFQLLAFRDLILFERGFAFPYIVLLLFLPYSTNRVLLLFSGFAMGLLVDMFYDTPGINAAACVLIMFLRPFWLDTTLGGNIEDNQRLNLGSLGFTWFFIYVVPLTLLHHLIIFFVEAGNTEMFWVTITKVLYSTVYSVICMFIFQFLFAYEGKKV